MEIPILILKLVLKPFRLLWKFLKEVKVEFSKVVWPTRKETISATVAIIILSLVVGLYLGLIDFGLSKGLEFLLSKVK